MKVVSMKVLPNSKETNAIENIFTNLINNNVVLSIVSILLIYCDDVFIRLHTI